VRKKYPFNPWPNKPMRRLVLSGLFALVFHAWLFTCSPDGVVPAGPSAPPSSGGVIIDLTEAKAVAPQSSDSPENQTDPLETTEKQNVIVPPPVEPIMPNNPEPFPAPLIKHKVGNDVGSKAKPPEQKTTKAKTDRKENAGIPNQSPSSNQGQQSSRVVGQQRNSSKTQDSSLLSVLATPLYKENRQPLYPPLARKRGQQGKVVLQVLVEASGRVGDLKITQTSGYPSLDKAALDAVRHWKFSPGKQTGISVPMWVVVPIVFSLN
jgi:protein TonB